LRHQYLVSVLRHRSTHGTPLELEGLSQALPRSASIAIYPATSSSEKARSTSLNRATGNRLKAGFGQPAAYQMSSTG
jgi:hypothetical protein